MGKASRDKGARGELEVAEKLRVWWEPLEEGVVFKRTPSSGGWGSKDDRSAFRVSGDLVTSSKSFPFVVEIKRRENWAWATLLAGKPCPVWGWWQQARKQALEQEGGVPLLIWRKSRQPWFAMLPERMLCGVTLSGPELATMTRWPEGSLRVLGEALQPVAFPLDVLLGISPIMFSDDMLP